LGGRDSGEWIRTFAIIATNANELIAEIHDRMPLISPAIISAG
jgi:putative SOS response-associated peptidase YedK